MRPCGNNGRLTRVIKFGFFCSILVNLILLSLLLTEENSHLSSWDVFREKTVKWKGEFVKHKFRYTIQNDNICNTESLSNETGIDLIFLIFSSVDHIARRTLIRQTWMTVARENEANIRYAFLLGLSKDKYKNSQLIQENDRHHDIVQENFLDDYQNLTLKTTMALKWAVSNCRSARFVFKADDDIFVNVQAVLHSILTINEEKLQFAVGGQCWNYEKPQRNKTSKYYISHKTYPYDAYPPFCSGTGYITSMKVVEEIYKISKNVAFFPLEDVYIGMCLKRLKYKVLNIVGFHNIQVPLVPCTDGIQYVITSHGNPSRYIQEVWNLKCEKHNYLKNYTKPAKPFGYNGAFFFPGNIDKSVFIFGLKF